MWSCIATAIPQIAASWPLLRSVIGMRPGGGWMVANQGCPAHDGGLRRHAWQNTGNPVGRVAWYGTPNSSITDCATYPRSN